MDRNPIRTATCAQVNGQARKSLWIETNEWGLIASVLKVRLVRACGSKQSRGSYCLRQSWVRLVRACGSKRLIISVPHVRLKVRLVRACGSKLVACIKVPLTIGGQARKSLWIETMYPAEIRSSRIGQARKSLWIETTRSVIFIDV